MAWDKDLPASDEKIGDISAEIIANWTALKTTIAVDHEYMGQTRDGQHTQVTLFERVAGDPTNVTDTGFLYTKEASSKTELFFLDEDGDAVQLTSGGSSTGGSDIFCYFDGTGGAKITPANYKGVDGTSLITHAATGTYKINFAASLTDANYTAIVQCLNSSSQAYWYHPFSVVKNKDYFQFVITRYNLFSAGGGHFYVTYAIADVDDINVTIYRNG